MTHSKQLFVGTMVNDALTRYSDWRIDSARGLCYVKYASSITRLLVMAFPFASVAAPVNFISGSIGAKMHVRGKQRVRSHALREFTVHG